MRVEVALYLNSREMDFDDGELEIIEKAVIALKFPFDSSIYIFEHKSCHFRNTEQIKPKSHRPEATGS